MPIIHAFTIVIQLDLYKCMVPSGHILMHSRRCADRPKMSKQLIKLSRGCDAFTPNIGYIFIGWTISPDIAFITAYADPKAIS